MHVRAGRARNRHRVAGMVAVAVGDQNEIEAPIFFAGSGHAGSTPPTARENPLTAGRREQKVECRAM
jgi:hypothetical protein